MQLFKNVQSFLSKPGRRTRVVRIERFNVRTVAMTAALLIAAIVTGGLVGRHLTRVRPSSLHQETTLAAVQVQAPVPPPGLSRKRKGFDDAIAVLGTAAAQNHRLVAYYDRVVKRTEGQSADAEPVESVKASVAGAKPTPLTQPAALGSAAASAAAGYSDPKVAAGAGGQLNNARQINSAPRAGSESSSLLSAQGLKTAAPVSGPASSGERAEPGRESGDFTKTSEDPSVGEALNTARGPARLVAGDLSFDLNPAINHWVNYYTESRVGRSTMQQGLNRCVEYLGKSRAEFKEWGLPEDLVWVAQVESVWKQGAYSRVAAGGIWQFMPRTAAEYGLTVGSADDERFDPAKETRAAATYLHDLYTLFGNWELALAAYNCGEPRLMDGIVRCGQPDFWELYDEQLLPKETRDYVPKILAAIKVASNPGAYGFTIDPPLSADSNTPLGAPGN